jgi:acyl carrier protein
VTHVETAGAPAEPALRDQDPALRDQVPALRGQVPALRDQVPALRGQDPALRDQLVGDICALLPKVLRRDVPGASQSTALMADLAMSSTTALELMLELEESLEIEISVEDLDRDDFATVGSLATYVAANLLPQD